MNKEKINWDKIEWDEFKMENKAESQVRQLFDYGIHIERDMPELKNCNNEDEVKKVAYNHAQDCEWFEGVFFAIENNKITFGPRYGDHELTELPKEMKEKYMENIHKYFTNECIIQWDLLNSGKITQSEKVKKFMTPIVESHEGAIFIGKVENENTINLFNKGDHKLLLEMVVFCMFKHPNFAALLENAVEFYRNEQTGETQH